MTVGITTAIVLGSRTVFSKALKGLSGNDLLKATTLLNMAALGSANASNVILMRRKEFLEGIPIKN